MGSNTKLKARPGARPALQALKEKERAEITEKPNQTGGLSKVFAQSAGALVPGQPAHAAKVTKTGDEPLRIQETLIGSEDSTRFNPFEAPTKKITTPNPPKKNEQKLPSSLLFVIGMGLGAILFSSGLRDMLFGSDKNLVTPAERMEWEENAQYHREHTGTKLNRQRVETEYENQLTAPTLPYGVKKVKEPDMMKGLPLAGEENDRIRDRIESVNPNYPDARTQITLEEEKKQREWEALAHKKYVEEFIANAARAGYTVRIDRDGVARIVGRVPVRREAGVKVDDRFPEHDSENGGVGASR